MNDKLPPKDVKGPLRRSTNEPTFEEALRHDKELDLKFQELEVLYEKKYQKQQQYIADLKRQFTDFQMEKETELVECADQQRTTIEDLRQRLEQSQVRYESEKATWEEYSQYVKAKYEEAMQQMNQEHETFETQLQAKLEKTDSESSDNTATKQRAPNRNEQDLQQLVMLKREIEVLRNEQKQQKQEFLFQQQASEQLFQQRMKQESDILTSRVQELENTLKNSETDTLNVQAELQQVELSRKVLKHQLQELQSKVTPKEVQIHSLQSQLQEFDVNRERNLNLINDLKHQLQEGKKKHKSLVGEMQRLRSSLQDSNKLNNLFRQEITRVATKVDGAKLAEGILKLYTRFCSEEKIPEDIEAGATVDETYGEVQRQRATLHRVVAGANKKATRAIGKLRAQRQKSTMENAALMDENKRLRKELLAMNQAYERGQAEIRHLTLRLSKATAEFSTMQLQHRPSLQSSKSRRSLASECTTKTRGRTSGTASGKSSRGSTMFGAGHARKSASGKSIFAEFDRPCTPEYPETLEENNQVFLDNLVQKMTIRPFTADGGGSQRAKRYSRESISR